MTTQRQLSVGALALFLSLGLACGDDTRPVDTGGGGSGNPPPDTTPPQAIGDLAIAWRPASKDVELTWTAPRDDDATDHVTRYDIRYAYSFPLDWDLSVAAAGVPDPGPEGTAQSYALAAPLRGRDLYVAARTLDAAGNPSPITPVAHLRVPGIHFEAVCTDVFTDAPVEGLDALLTAGGAWNATSGADGRISLDNVTGGTLGMEIQSGSAGTTYHTFQNTLVVDDDTAISIPMIPVIDADYTGYDNVLQIVVSALVNGGAGKVLKRWNAYPIPFHAPAFTNINGLNYTELTRQAAAQWNLRTGLPIFVEVGSLPASGIEFQYPDRTVMGIQNGYTSHTQDAEGFPAGELVRIVDDFSDSAKLYSILMHELGHCIRLGHLPQGFLMFAGQPLPPDVTGDEVRTVQMMLAIPNGTDLARYDPDTPLP